MTSLDSSLICLELEGYSVMDWPGSRYSSLNLQHCYIQSLISFFVLFNIHNVHCLLSEQCVVFVIPPVVIVIPPVLYGVKKRCFTFVSQRHLTWLYNLSLSGGNIIDRVAN